MSTKVAVVTGSNKGIGFATVKALCSKFDGHVYLTARDENRGKAAIQELQQQGLDPKFHLLDIESEDSIKKFASYLQSTYGGLDVLVNNAAIAYPVASTVPFAEQAANTIGVNFFATLNVCRGLFPLLRPHARVVNVSSCLGTLSHIPNEDLRKKFLNPDLTEDELCKLMQQFVDGHLENCTKAINYLYVIVPNNPKKVVDIADEFVGVMSLHDAKAGAHVAKGWPNSAYQMSKIGVIALSFIQHRKFCKDPSKDIVVNSVHPGYVDTDMTNHKGILKPDQGAEAPVYLALLPPNVESPRGEFVWYDKTIGRWS